MMHAADVGGDVARLAGWLSVHAMVVVEPREGAVGSEHP